MKRRVQRPAVRRRSPRFLRRSKRLATKRRVVAPRKSRVYNKSRVGRGLKMDVGMYTGGSNYTGGYMPYSAVGSKRGYNVGVLEWVNLKLLFRSPTKRPGWYKISIVQFMDDDPLPGAGTTAHNAFWQKRAKALLYNPISHEVTGAYGGKDWTGCKVLQQKIIRFNPDTSTNLADYGGEQHRYDLFLRLNRFVNQRKKEGQAQRVNTLFTDLYTEEGAPGTVANETDIQVFNTAAEPRARVFVIIEATYWDSAVLSGTSDTLYKETAASFDMEVRTKWIYKQPYA